MSRLTATVYVAILAVLPATINVTTAVAQTHV